MLYNTKETAYENNCMKIKLRGQRFFITEAAVVAHRILVSNICTSGYINALRTGLVELKSVLNPWKSIFNNNEVFLTFIPFIKIISYTYYCCTAIK